jgi:hypothetical protein
MNRFERASEHSIGSPWTAFLRNCFSHIFKNKNNCVPKTWKTCQEAGEKGWGTIRVLHFARKKIKIKMHFSKIMEKQNHISIVAQLLLDYWSDCDQTWWVNHIWAKDGSYLYENFPGFFSEKICYIHTRVSLLQLYKEVEILTRACHQKIPSPPQS